MASRRLPRSLNVPASIANDRRKWRWRDGGVNVGEFVGDFENDRKRLPRLQKKF